MAIQVAQVSIEVDASPDSVWRALTTAETLGRSFFGSKVETDWKPGSPIYFRGEWKGKQFEDKGKIRAFSPGKQLRFTHWSNLAGLPDAPENYHIVTFDISPAASKSKVTVTQENETDKPVSPAAKQELTKNWTAILGRLKEAVEEAPP